MTLPDVDGIAPAYDAFLFDMDGTILSSVAVIERIWGRWARRHGLDPDVLIPTIHGIRAADVIARLGLPGLDPRAEALVIEAEEMDDVDGIAPIPGAADFLAALPRDRWAIVTSAPAELARRRIAAAGLPFPDAIVTGEDVARGKPDPACFLLGAGRLAADPTRCLAFEDAPAGLAAATAAGCSVIMVTATHRHTTPAHPTTIRDYHDEGAHRMRARLARPAREIDRRR